MLRKICFVAVAALVAVPASFAAPIVTMSKNDNIGGTGNTAYDFSYLAGAGAEFTAYEINLTLTKGGLLDPIRGGSGGQSDEGGDAIDTWANTVGSLLGAGSASYSFNTYNPVGFSPTPLPATSLNWSVFDTLEGDTDSVGPSPYKLVRLLVSPDAVGTLQFNAFNNQSGSVGTMFSFQIGIPEPATFAMAGMGLIGMVGLVRRRKA